MSQRIKTLIVDDQLLYREAVCSLLALEDGIEVVGQASDGEEAVRLARRHRPDVVLMDLRMPAMEGIEATRCIRSACPEARVLVLTTFDDEAGLFESLRAGASGYVLKNIPSAQLVEAIQIVAGGETYLQPSVASQVVKEFTRLSLTNAATRDARRIAALLSQRERDILQNLVRGMSNKEIAAALDITEGTVKNHMSNVLNKLEVPDRTSAALKARDLGLG